MSESTEPTRRIFLGVGAATPVLVGAIKAAVNPLQQSIRDTLTTIMDLMIPESDGMPSASRAGGLSYLEGLIQRDKNAAVDIAKGLAVTEAFSERSFKKPFHQLEQKDQIAVLEEMENSAPRVFDSLRAYVYESYYIQPAIWKLIGYELFPTDHMGPHLKPFDDSLLANVRNMQKLYRDA